jgi:hypothetical protein
MGMILDHQQETAAERLTTNILNSNGLRGNAIDVDAARFNQATECYYRTDLWKEHMAEGLRVLAEDGLQFDRDGVQQLGRMAGIVTDGCSAATCIDQLGAKVISGQATGVELQRLILLSLLIVEQKQRWQDKNTSHQ